MVRRANRRKELANVATPYSILSNGSGPNGPQHHRPEQSGSQHHKISISNAKNLVIFHTRRIMAMNHDDDRLPCGS